MRLVFVGPFGFAPKKTMRARALRLAHALVAQGHAVRLVMPPWETPEEAGRRWTEEGVEIVYVSLGGGLPGIMRRLLAETMAFQPDVVHSFKPKAYSGLAAWWLWQTRRHRLTLVTDSDDWEGAGGWNDRGDYTPLQRRFFAWQERWGLTHCHRLTVASRALESLAWAHGMPPERVVYLPNGPGIGADLTAATARRAALGLGDRPVLLLYSRLFEFDIARLTDVLRRVRAAVPDLALLTVGAGLFDEDAGALRAQFAAAGLLDSVVDVGWLAEEALPATLAAADVGLYLMDDTLLNRAKCPVKLADMLQSGVPVVGEAVGQVTEYVVDGVSGLTAPSGDAAGVAERVVALLRDREHRAALSAGARAHVAAHFGWAALAGVYTSQVLRPQRLRK